MVAYKSLKNSFIIHKEKQKKLVFKKKPFTAAFSLACLKIRSRNEEAINSTQNETDLLAKCFLLPTFLTLILFTCF